MTSPRALHRRSCRNSSGAPIRAATRAKAHATAFAVACAVAFATTLAACGPSAADKRADSVAAAAAEQARLDSIENVKNATVDTAIAPSLGVNLAAMEKLPNGVLILDKRKGSGAPADSNHWIEVAYTAYLTDGTIVDDTRKTNEPRKVLLGHKQVLPAWEVGLKGMREGGRRTLVTPPIHAYGKAGKPAPIPPLATLIFDIELRKVY